MTGSRNFLGIGVSGVHTSVGLNTVLGTGCGSGNSTVIPDMYCFSFALTDGDSAAVFVYGNYSDRNGGLGLKLAYYEVRAKRVYYVSTVKVDTVVARAIYVVPVELNLAALVLVGRGSVNGNRIGLFCVSNYAQSKGECYYERKHCNERENSSQRV